jgi:glycosylphosphatidylinositol deacylase
MEIFSLLLRAVLTISILVLSGIGIHEYLTNIDVNDCTMTMMIPPGYIPVEFSPEISAKFRRYQLYLHCGTGNCNLKQKVSYNLPGNIPILFITGNADSHSVVRSLSSQAMAKSMQPKYASQMINMNYFTISFNEELSALYGPVLKDQTEFVKHSIKRILSLYESVELLVNQFLKLKKNISFMA